MVENRQAQCFELKYLLGVTMQAINSPYQVIANTMALAKIMPVVRCWKAVLSWII